MAGLNLAYSLERAGYDVSVFEAESEIASKASGNKRGMLYPLISKKPDRLGSLTEAGAHFSYCQIKELGVDCREGLLEFVSSDNKEARFEEAIGRYSPDYLELVNDSNSKKAMLHKKALSLSPREYATALSESLKGPSFFSKRLKTLDHHGDDCLLTFEDGTKELFAAVFMAGAYESAQFGQVAHLPLRRSRGQVVYLDKDLVNSKEKDLNFINYLTEADDCYVLGASFDVDDFDENFRPQDSKILLDSLNRTFPDLLGDVADSEKLSGRVCFRTVLKDYFPVVGAGPDETFYRKTYGDLKHGKPISRYEEAAYSKNLFLSCGHGSRGLSFAPLSAVYLARLLRDGIHILNTSHVQAVHPGRFLIKELKKA